MFDIVTLTNLKCMDFATRKIIKISIGDKVLINKATNASLNLYMKTKQHGMVYIKCPCNAKSTTVLEVIAQFSGGFILKSADGLQTVAHPNDLRKVS